MRRLLSCESLQSTNLSELHLDEIICATRILELIGDILQFKINSDEHYFMRCEALWILTNLAAVPEDECL